MNERTEKTIRLVKQAIVSIDSFLANPTINQEATAQCAGFRATFERMLKNIQEDTLPPRDQRSDYMGRAIIDSWRPLNSPVADLIISAEKAYIEL
jgi:hypothetical protein